MPADCPGLSTLSLSPLPMVAILYWLMAFRSGFVSILGRPNAGKSTLLNRMVGQKVAIVSDKPQTTRYALQGVARGLRLVAYNRDLLTHHAIQQRRFAGVGTAQYGNESGTKGHKP